MTLREMIDAANRAVHDGDEELAVLWMNILRESAKVRAELLPADEMEAARKIIEKVANEKYRH